jgi:16S rRNA (adenine1518-N6/adenine1519-N6)-dimethyltransferase
MIPESPGEIRRTLERIGAHPRRRLGQNFLADVNLRDAIVAAAGIEPGDLVLEVGPGLGMLTKGLLDAGAIVVAAELDPLLAAFLREEWGAEPRLRIVEGDALSRGDLSVAVREALRAERERAARFLLVANLPYGISTPLLAAMAVDPEAPERVVVMVQKEVALRMAGRPGCGDYGPLAVLLALRGVVRVLRDVGGKVFYPHAPVRSAVVEVERRPVDPGRLAAGNRAARAAFRHRRKSLRRTLELAGFGPEAVEAALERAGAAAQDRPEVITPQQFVLIGEALFGEAFPPPV